MVIKEIIRPKGVPILVDAVRIKDKTFVVCGSILKIASLKKEWQDDVDDPEEVVRALKSSGLRIDLLKFWQRIPETKPKFPYYMEWREVAIIRITTFEHWWEKQINSNTRRLVKKSAKLGVAVREVKLKDEVVRGIMEIFNESPVRRGKRFRHYGKGFETVKKEMSADLEESIFIAAYYNKELIGFIKLTLTDRYAMVTMILDKKSHRDKTPVNGMLAHAVKICVEREIPLLTYTLWRKGGHAYFQDRNGFRPTPVPQYYVPLTPLGMLALRVGLHNGLRGVLPETMIVWVLRMRAKWYSLKLARRLAFRAKEESSATLSP